MSNYRHSENAPVPFHELDRGMATSMHSEIRMLYGLLCDTLKVVAHYVDEQEWENIDAEKMAEEAIKRTLKEQA